MEGRYDTCSEDLFNVTTKLEDKEKVLSTAEADVANLSRRILLVEDEVQRSEERLGKAVKDLCTESQRADNTIRSRQRLEQEQTMHEESIDTIESQLKEARYSIQNEADQCKESTLAASFSKVHAVRVRAQVRRHLSQAGQDGVRPGKVQ